MEFNMCSAHFSNSYKMDVVPIVSYDRYFLKHWNSESKVSCLPKSYTPERISLSYALVVSVFIEMSIKGCKILIVE